MCGIFAEVLSNQIPHLPHWAFWKGISGKQQLTPKHAPLESNQNYSFPRVKLSLQRRGPDEMLTEVINNTESTIHIAQTILSLRGIHRSHQISTTSATDGNRLLFNGEIFDGITISEDGSDFAALSLYLNHITEQRALTPQDLDVLRGPWTIIYWHATAKRLYFARDCIGRRSLLLRVIPGKSITLSSVAPKDDPQGFVEVPPAGVAYVDLSNKPEFGLFERQFHSVVPRRAISTFQKDAPKNYSICGSGLEMYVSFLPKSWLRSHPSPRISTPLTLKESAERFIDLFRQSTRRRLAINIQTHSLEPRFAVLFSGGIDSLFISVILEQCLPQGEPLHLINVAFAKDAQSFAECPDRVNALHGFDELKTICARRRKIELICVNVLPQQADYSLEHHVRHLLHPCNQPMDATIGTALWFASRGEGVNTEHSLISKNEVRTSARVLFSGLGADELMGGYKGRHRTIFRNDGTEGILREIDADFSRLWFRNLGRDDRLTADHGKEVRHPFLDEDLVDFVTGLPLIEHVCDLSKADGIGDKHLLRRAAKLVGISEAGTSRVKRAIQFGSRSRHILERKSLRTTSRPR